MKVSFNKDEEIVKTIKEGLERTGSFLSLISRFKDNFFACRNIKAAEWRKLWLKSLLPKRTLKMKF